MYVVMRKMPDSQIADFLRTTASNMRDLLLSSDDFVKRSSDETGLHCQKWVVVVYAHAFGNKEVREERLSKPRSPLKEGQGQG